MPKFGARSKQNLSECHIDIQTVFNVVIKTHDCAVHEGARPRAEQELAVQQKKSKAHWPNSNHNVDGVKRKTSWAADVSPYPIDWSNRPRYERFAAYVLCVAKDLLAQGKISHEMRNGGDWDRDGIFDDWDMPHFELLGVADGE